MRPTISLVMPTLNAAAHIRDALASVERQSYAGDVEVVLADGGSSDNTRELGIADPHAHVLDGGDTGIYDGFNRAVAAAQGDLIGFLNADDWLEDGALDRIATAATSSTADIFSGHAIFDAPNDARTTRSNNQAYTIEGGIFGIPAINTRFFRRDALARLGPFDMQIGLAADRGFLLRIPPKGLRTHGIDAPIYRYRIHAGSATIAGTPDAHARVLKAEYALMGALLVDPEMSQHTVIVRQACALIRFKAGRRRVTLPPLGAMPAPSPRELLAGLAKWYKWRGKLSGY